MLSVQGTQERDSKTISKLHVTRNAPNKLKVGPWHPAGCYTHKLCTGDADCPAVLSARGLLTAIRFLRLTKDKEVLPPDF